MYSTSFSSSSLDVFASTTTPKDIRILEESVILHVTVDRLIGRKPTAKKQFYSAT